jgi:CRISPR-associated protein Cas5d
MSGIRLKVWGDYGLFTRPEMKVERVSYDIINPSAARGILDAIYWHPGMRWVVDRIYVLNPIHFTNIRRNEVKSKVLANKVYSMMKGSAEDIAISTSDDILQRASTLLKDVCYVLEAHFELTDQLQERDSQEKFYAIARRRMTKGQYYHQPCMGCREFPAYFQLLEDQEPIQTAYDGMEMDLGYMLYDMEYQTEGDILPQFFRAVLVNGILDLRECEVVK